MDNQQIDNKQGKEKALAFYQKILMPIEVKEFIVADTSLDIPEQSVDNFQHGSSAEKEAKNDG